MAIAVDASSPARVSAATAASATTAAFNPPVCVLVVCTSGDTGPGASTTVTVTSNGTALTWVPVQTRSSSDTGAATGGVAAIHYAILTGARTAMTVTSTITGTGSAAASMKVYCLTGVDTTTPLGASTKSSATTNNLTTNAITTVGAAGLGLVCGTDYNQLGVPVSADTTFSGFDTSGHISGGSGYKTLAAAGSSATFNLDAGGTGAADWNYAVAEFLAAAGGGAPDPVPARPVVAPMGAAHTSGSW